MHKNAKDKALEEFKENIRERNEDFKRDIAIIIANNPEIIELTKRMVRSSWGLYVKGFTSIICNNLKEAQWKIEKNHKTIGLIIIDKATYGEEAVDFYNNIKANELFNNIKVVLFTRRN